ncbi:M48 family metalloprotease [Halomonas sp. McH1-25]|uniref:M48 family metalloprotease n=1 Tax=unclassified Halomonas TaxID=2609666 RepID=UPI001EF6186F|nr:MULTISPECIES: M48 family metalloprotease [unclassified Halomonas]MCG7600742.1 M48 family metalloprotease [Halomonas sp. McH1-25]MCP1341320.1 M48 family metalloprotease [Halomonas sp. FL8]MCP1363048.1 M48 family metalloprotease [Halomonas sp. BBD45]
MLRTFKSCLTIGALALVPCAMPAVADDYGLPSLGSGASSVSGNEEHRLGRAWLRQFRAQTDTWQDPIAQTYVDSLIERLLPYSDLGDIRIVTTLVDSRLLNAFAVPGGVVGVNAGLFAFAESEDAFASVLAHELGHLSQRHYARRMERVEETQLPTMAAMLAGMVIAAGGGGNAGLAAMMGSQAAFIQDQLAYSRRFEQEADRVGLEAMTQAGFDPQAMPAMFRAMQRLTSLQGGNPPEFLLTHPVTESRISDTQSRADQLPSSTRRDSDPAYALIRARALLELNGDNPAQAMAQLRQDDSPTSAERYLQALIAARQERIDEALATLDALSRELPDLSLIPATAVEIALNAGRRDDALTRAERILRLSPNYFPARLLRAEILLQQSPGDAFDVLRELSQQYSETPQVFALLAEAAGRSGHETWGHLARAESLQLTGHIDRAIKQLDVAEDVAKRSDDFSMASRIRQRREDFMDYRETLRQF